MNTAFKKNVRKYTRVIVENFDYPFFIFYPKLVYLNC